MWPFELTEFVGNGFDTDAYVLAAAAAASPPARPFNPAPAASASAPSAAQGIPTPEFLAAIAAAFKLPSLYEARQLLARLLMDSDTQRRYPLESSARFWEFSAIWHGLDPGLVDLEKPERREFLRWVAALSFTESPALLNFLNAIDAAQVLRDLGRWPEAIVHFDEAAPHLSVISIRILAEQMREVPERSCTPVPRKPRHLTVYQTTEDFGKLLKASLDDHPGWLDRSIDGPRPSATALQEKLAALGVSSDRLVRAGATYLNSEAVRNGGNLPKSDGRRSKARAAAKGKEPKKARQQRKTDPQKR